MINPLTQQPIADDQLASIASLAKMQVALEKRIEKGEQLLEELKTQLRDISEKQLPDAMSAIGMESFSLADGTKVFVDKFYAGSISPENADKAFAWLRSNNFDSIIKRVVTCKFGKGQDKDAAKAITLLKKSGLNPENKESIHPQTLKAFIREQMEAGTNLPTDLLGVYVGNKAKITQAE